MSVLFFISGNVAHAYDFSSYGITASNAILSITSTKELNELSKIIKDQLKNLRSGSLRKNIYISSVSLALPSGTDFGSTGMVIDQQLKVLVKSNNQFGPALNTKDIDYEVYLYDTTKTRDKKLFKAAAGIINLSNGYSEVIVNLEGGLPFDGKNYEKKYRALIVIDSSKDVMESNEKDNKFWSDEWLITYYKG